MDYKGLVPCLLSCLLYYNALDAGFVYDDSRAILTNPDVLGSRSLDEMWRHDFWGTPLDSASSHGSYRPLTVLTFRANQIVSGLRPWSFHAANVLLHTLVTGLVYRLGRDLLPKGPSALLASLLFAVHPIHTEAVTGLVGRADLAAAACHLLALLSFAHFTSRRDSGKPHWHLMIVTLLSSTAAMLFKETGITALATCAVYDLIRSPRAHSKRSDLMISLLILGTTGISLLAFRLHVMGMQAPNFAASDNPAAHSPSLLTRTLTFLYLPVLNFSLLIWPQYLSFDWSMESVPRLTSLVDPRNLLTLAFYLGLYALVSSALTRTFHKTQCGACTKSLQQHDFRCRLKNNNNLTLKCDCPSQMRLGWNESLLLAAALLVIPFFPAANAFFYVGFVIAERVLYLPSVGYCLLVAIGTSYLKQKSHKGIKTFFIVLLIVFSGKTVIRNRDWMNEESLYRAGIPINPPKAYGNLGSILGSQGRYEEAEKAYKLALHFRPNMAEVHYNLGNLLQGREKFEEAISSYERAIHYRSSLAVAYLNLGHALAGVGRCKEAEGVWNKCWTLSGEGVKDPGAHAKARLGCVLAMGRLFTQHSRHSEAAVLYKEAISTLKGYYQPQTLFNLMGEALSLAGEHEEAEMWFKAALHAKPDHIPAHLTYGKLLAKNRTRVVEAEKLFLKAQKLAPGDPSVYHHFGQFLSGLERHSEAAATYLRALELSPTEYELVVSAATELRRAGHMDQAEQLYRRAVSIRPDIGESHSNLGAMLHLNGKFLEAAESYKKALQLDPEDATTVQNFKKLRKLTSTPES